MKLGKTWQLVKEKPETDLNKLIDYFNLKLLTINYEKNNLSLFRLL